MRQVLIASAVAALIAGPALAQVPGSVTSGTNVAGGTTVTGPAIAAPAPTSALLGGQATATTGVTTAPVTGSVVTRAARSATDAARDTAASGADRTAASNDAKVDARKKQDEKAPAAVSTGATGATTPPN